MSFILDALRKSEHDRQRAAMPGIAQVPFGAPRRQMPLWPMIVIGLLAAAVLVLGAAWWRSASSDAAAVATPAPAATNVPLPLPPATVATPPATSYSSPPPAARGTDRPAAPSSDPIASGTPAEAPREAAPRPAVAQGPGPATSTPVAPSPGTAPAAEPEPADTATLPSAEALAAEGVAVPPLRLELHAYAPRAADRFVFINGSKYLEGATLAEGPRIVAIAPNGAVLSYLGRRFLLSPQ